MEPYKAKEKRIKYREPHTSLYVNEDNYEKLVALKKETLALPEYDKRRDRANPFAWLGRSLFINRAAVKLANLDFIFNLSEHVPGQGNYQTKISNGSNFSFCDLAGGPGGFSQYLLWRRPFSAGFGITLKTQDHRDWDKNILANNRFNMTYGKDLTGDLYTNDEWFTNWLLDQKPQGVDLVVADGGFDVETEPDFRRREILTSRLVLVQLYVGIQVCGIGKHLICKVFDTNTDLSASYLYLVSLCFEKIYLVKPVSSRPASNEKYLVCLSRKEDVNEPLGFLATLRDMYENTDLPEFAVDLPSSFRKWLESHNNLFTNNVIQAAEAILKEQRSTSDYNYFDCFTLWQLPG